MEHIFLALRSDFNKTAHDIVAIKIGGMIRVMGHKKGKLRMSLILEALQVFAEI